jgi:hypothetical protein
LVAFGEGNRIASTNECAGPVCHAPSFISGGRELSGRPESSYTATTLSKFLGGEKGGRSKSKVEAILLTLAAVEVRLIERGDLTGLSTRQGRDHAMGRHR